jgi:hypothetical protein
MEEGSTYLGIDFGSLYQLQKVPRLDVTDSFQTLGILSLSFLIPNEAGANSTPALYQLFY